jgi:hypothetical protein
MLGAEFCPPPHLPHADNSLSLSLSDTLGVINGQLDNGTMSYIPWILDTDSPPV